MITIPIHIVLKIVHTFIYTFFFIKCNVITVFYSHKFYISSENKIHKNYKLHFINIKYVGL